MKNIILSIALLCSIFSASAQTNFYSTSFETSEGFEIGPLSGQNGWNESSSATGSAVISDNFAQGDGSQSLQIIGLNGTNHSLVGAFSPIEVITSNLVTIEFDVYFGALNDSGSSFIFSPQSLSQALPTSRFLFTNDGEVLVLGVDPDDELALSSYIPTAATFEAGQWYHAAIVHNFANGIIQYYFEDELLFTSTVFGGTNLEQIVVLNDNFNTTAYFDNITTSATTLDIRSESRAQFTVYPNPAHDRVNISSGDNSVATSISIVDLNGRFVKSVILEHLTTNSINIAELSNGVYMMTINSDLGSVTKKVIKN